MPIDFDMCSVFNDHNIWILHKATPLDLLAQVAGTLGDNRRLYSAPTSYGTFSTTPYIKINRHFDMSTPKILWCLQTIPITVRHEYLKACTGLGSLHIYHKIMLADDMIIVLTKNYI